MTDRPGGGEELWQCTDEMSKCKKKPPTMIYYAAPYPYRYGFFAATVKERRDEFLRTRALTKATDTESDR